VSAEEAEELRTLAAAYREKFGRPLVICVDNVVDRKHLLSSGWRRVEGVPGAGRGGCGCRCRPQGGL